MTPDLLAEEIFNLIPQGMRFLRTRLNAMTDGHLSIPQFRIMLYLNEHPAGQTELCAFLHVKPPTISRMLRCLHARGYIISEVGARDARARELKLSPKGRKYVKLYRTQVMRELNTRVLNLPKTQAVQLEKSLAVLSRLLHAPDQGVE